MQGTIKSKGEIERLFRTGRRSSSYLATILTTDSAGSGRCAFIAGKKLGTAPTRSRCKRVMRAAVRELGGPWETADVVFIAHRRIASARHEQVLRQLSRQLRELGVLDG